MTTTTCYFFGVCRDCEFSVVTDGIPPPLARCCPLCAEDNGRDVFMGFQPATADDKPEGYDARLLSRRDE